MKIPRHHFKFMTQFVDDVRAGRKRCTIRAERKRQANPGDTAVLSHWEGKAYRSKSVLIGDVTLTRVAKLSIVEHPTAGQLAVLIDGRLVGAEGVETLAVHDGFADAAALFEFFRARVPFDGNLYVWDEIPKL